MKKWLLSILSVLCMLMMALGLTACGGGGGASENGTYYEYVSNDYNRSSYVSLDDGSWTDNDGYAGTYTITNGEIVFIVDGFPLMDGEISNGVIKIPSLFGATYYCKEGKTPSNMGNGGGSSQPPATTYTVTYNSNGGAFEGDASTTTQTVTENSLLTAPDSPTRTNYRFSGWSKNVFGTEMWNFEESTVTSNVTLYAVWVQESAKILSVDNANITGTDVLMIVDSTVDNVSLANKVVCSEDSTWKLYYDRLGQTEIPTKIAASMSGILVNGDNVFYMVVTSQDGTQVNVYNLTVHRKHIISVTYSHNLNLLEVETVYSGEEYVADYVPTIEGYTFNCWKTIDGEAFTADTLFRGLSLYADATANTYTATLDVSGGEELTENTQEMTYDSTFTLPVPTRTGYTFLGWYNDDVAVTTGEGNGILVWKIAQDTTLQARWQINAYDVTVSSNNESAGTVSGGGTYNYDSSVTLTATTNNGYTWLGWYDGETKVTDEFSYTFRAMEDKTLMAKWMACPITLEKNIAEAGSVSGVEKTILGKETTITATTNLGYTFVGWYDGTTKLTDELSYTFEMPTENKTFTAKYDVVEGLENFELISTSTTIKITGVKDTSVTEIVVPDSVTSIGGDAFRNCDSLTSVTIGDSVTSIGSSAFSGCTNLTSIDIPDSVESIGERAFYDCTSLTKVNCTGTIDGWAQIEFSNGSANPINYAKNLYINDVLVTEANITTATKISDRAFYECDSLTSVTIGDSVESIGDHAFSYCYSLTSVTIGDSVESIGYTTFTYCTSLTSVTIGDSVTSIGDHAFSICDSLTSVIIPDSVTSIGDHAFSYCYSLTSVTIGDSVTSIDAYAFYDCTSLTSVYYKGTASEWGEISVGSNNTKLTNATRYYYVENEADVPASGNYWHYVDGVPAKWE